MENELELRLLESTPERDSVYQRVWDENKLIWRTAFPAILFRLSMFGVFLVTQSFVGRISDVDLAAYALVQIILVRFSNGILPWTLACLHEIGMSSATETLCGQAFGAKQYHMMGIYLQRSWIVDAVTATLILPFFIFSRPLYKLLGQEDDISDATEEISLWFIGVLYAFVFSLTMEMFLQAQRKNMLIGLLSPLTFLLHLLLSWIFVDKLGWGIGGAMSALVLSRWVFVALMAIYIFGGWCPQTWTGFSIEAFRDMIPVVKLSISSGVMLCVQLWYNSFLVLLAGYTSDATVNISAFSICLNINAWQYMVCLGFTGAACVRVSNEVGRGNAKTAKFSIMLILTTSVTFGLLCCVLCLVFGRQIPYLFTTDDEVAKAATNLIGLLALTMFIMSFQAVFTGVAVGTGSQAKVAFVNIFSYYIIGIPVGCILAYVAHYDIMGIWIGLLSGQIVQALVLGYMTWKIDWAAEVNKATERLNRFYLNQNEEDDRNAHN